MRIVYRKELGSDSDALNRRKYLEDLKEESILVNQILKYTSEEYMPNRSFERELEDLREILSEMARLQ